jgi:hypothetical protein
MRSAAALQERSVLAFGSLLGVALVVAFLTTGSTPRRALGLLVATSVFAMPWLAPDAPPIGRGLLALMAVWMFARAIDLARDRPRSFTSRLALTVALFDSREAQRKPAEFDTGALLAAAGYLGLAFASLVVAISVSAQLDGGWRWALRWTAGLAFVYAFPDAVAAGMRFVYGLIGWRLPEMHRVPIASRSLGEFWGKRWNRVVGSWLRRHCFLPLARRRMPAAGMAFAFVVSTALHVWFAGVAVGIIGGLMMGAYFVIEGVLVLLENQVRPGPVAGRAWAVLGAGLPAPLFIEPMLWMFGPAIEGLGTTAGWA